MLYAVVNDNVTSIVKGITLTMDIKQSIQRNICNKPEQNNIKGSSVMVDVLSKVSPDMMRQAQEEDLDISKTICFMTIFKTICLIGKEAISCTKWKNKIKNSAEVPSSIRPVGFCKSVLHRIYEENGSKYHQLVLTIKCKP